MTDVEILSLESAKSPTQIQEILKNKNFSSSFWGEKLVGFETLWSNLRSSSTSVKELEVSYYYFFRFIVLCLIQQSNSFILILSKS